MGELLNTTAYAFAPAVLVTPLGALSVALLGSYFLNEEIGTLGRLACTTCLLGTLLLALHAPADKEINTIEEILHLALRPSTQQPPHDNALSLYLIYQVAPLKGKTNPLVYISICSWMGSLSVLCVKALSISVKLTVAGHNQFTHASTYIFIVALVATTLIQTNYLNKAMNSFDASLVNAMFYVGFTICTFTASSIFFQGLNLSGATEMELFLCGILLNITGVAILVLPKAASSDYSPVLRYADRGVSLELSTIHRYQAISRADES
ncbi:hypothetical protein KXV25_006362 [Aspergillus fumigatus]|nr:hypothetical protein KXV25_006362 [Aspergillus fumigatus]